MLKYYACFVQNGGGLRFASDKLYTLENKRKSDIFLKQLSETNIF